MCALTPRWTLLVGLLCLLPWSPADAATEWDPIPSDLTSITDCPNEPGCPAAILLDETRVDNEYYRARVYKHRIIKIFKPEGLDAAAVSIRYIVGRWGVFELEGRTIHPDGTTVALDPTKAITQTTVKESGFRGKEQTFQMPAAEVGAYLEYRYRLSYQYQFSSYEWVVQDVYPIVKAVFAAAPGDEDWTVTILRLDGVRHVADADEEGRTRYTFHAVPSFKKEPLMPPEDECRGRVLFYPKYPRWGWKDLGRVVHTYYEDKFFKRGKQAHKLAVQLIEGAPDANAKIERIYDWIQNNLDNTSFTESAEGEVQDTKPNLYVDDVLAAKQGNHEDLTRLFAFMAKAAGLEAEVALVASRDNTLFRKDVLDLYQFDDEVAAIRMGEDWHFYDPGTRYCPVGMVGAEFEGVQENALVTRDGGGFVTRVPNSRANDNLLRRTGKADITEDGALTLDVDVEAFGLAGEELRNQIDHLTAEERRKFLEDRVRKGIADSRVEEFSVSNLSALAEPLRIHYQVRADAYAAAAGSRLLVPAFPLHLGAANPLPSPTRQNPILYPRTSRDLEEVTLRVPDGFEVESLPVPRLLDLSAIQYQTKASQDGEEVKVSRDLVVDVLMVPASRYGVVRHLYEEAARLDGSQIVLRRKGTSPEPPPEPAPGAGR
jgi:hypothetical protein